MSSSKWIVRLAVLVVATAACSKGEDTASKNDKMTMQGTVSTQLQAGGGVEAVAIGQDGRTFWSALDQKGEFKLVVPAGQSYRIVLAHAVQGGQKSSIVSSLALTSALGKTQWVMAKEGSTLRLGQLVPAGTNKAAAATTGGGGLKTLTSGSGRGGDGSSVDDGSGRGGSGRGGSGRGGSDGADDSDDHDDYDDDQSHADDPECHEKDSGAASMCSAPGAGEMECSRNDSEDVHESGDWGGGSSASSDETCAPAPADSTTTPPASSPTESNGAAVPPASDGLR
jgi:hypothetical protein